MDAAQSSANRERPQLDPVFVFWLAALFVITGLGALPLFFYRIDLSKLTFSSPIPVLVGIGIEITAYAPTLAALLVVAMVPGGGGIRRLLRPVARWRIGLSWYLLALLGPSVLFIVGDLVRVGLGLALPPHWLVIPGAAAIAFLLGALIAGSFGEEVGWRGLGQPPAGEIWCAMGSDRSRRSLEHVASVAGPGSWRTQQHDLVRRRPHIRSPGRDVDCLRMDLQRDTRKPPDRDARARWPQPGGAICARRG